MLCHLNQIAILLPSATKLHQGNIFTPVCHSVHRRVSATPPPPGQTPPPLSGRQPPRSACWNTVNKRVVRILLECNLVIYSFVANLH